MLEGKAAAPIIASQAKDEFVETDAEGTVVARRDDAPRGRKPPPRGNKPAPRGKPVGVAARKGAKPKPDAAPAAE